MASPLRSDTGFVVVDCESTGLDSRARLIEIAGISCSSNWCPDQIFDSLVNPGHFIPRDIVRITGITNSMVADAPATDVVLLRFLQWIPSNVIVAHNAEFDLRLLAQEARRVGIVWPDLLFIDTLQIARTLNETSDSRLATLVSHYRLPVTNEYHRALADAWSVIAYMQTLLAIGRLESFARLLEPRVFDSK